MNDLKKWLDSEKSSFDDGLVLFAKYAKDKSYLPYFERNKESSPQSQPWNILRDELRRIPIFLDVIPQPSTSAKLTEQEASKVAETVRKLEQVASKSDNPFFNPNELPDAAKPMFARVKDIGKELASNKASLDKATSDEERKEYANALCILEDERYDLWDKIDALRDNQNAEKVDESKNAAARAVNLYKRYLILRNNIARNEKEAGRVLDDKRKEKLIAGAEKFKQELVDVENEFENITGLIFEPKPE